VLALKEVKYTLQSETFQSLVFLNTNGVISKKPSMFFFSCQSNLMKDYLY